MRYCLRCRKMQPNTHTEDVCRQDYLARIQEAIKRQDEIEWLEDRYTIQERSTTS